MKYNKMHCCSWFQRASKPEDGRADYSPWWWCMATYCRWHWCHCARCEDKTNNIDDLTSWPHLLSHVRLKRKTTHDTKAKLPEKPAPYGGAKIWMYEETELPHYLQLYDSSRFLRRPGGRNWDSLDAWLGLHSTFPMRCAMNCKSRWRNSGCSSRTTDEQDGMQKCDQGSEDVPPSKRGGR